MSAEGWGSLMGHTADSVDLLGEWPVYPGHALTTAYCIVSHFGSMSEAMEKSENTNYPAALRDQRIPGAGGCVWSAIYFLRYLAERSMDWEAAVQWASDRWREETSSAYKDKWMPGQEQADRLMPKLHELREWWEKEWSEEKSSDG